MKLAALMRRASSLLLMLGLAAALIRPAGASPLAAQPRPVLSGPEHTYSTDRVMIHYTLSGIDAVPAADSDGDGTPDWVAEVGAVIEQVWRVEVDRLGWPAPIPDRGEGGDTRVDVYLMELFSKGVAGYVSPDGGFVGDNPATARTETQAAYGYLVFENDFIDPAPPAGLRVWPPADWLRIIAAHEFNHLLQVGINGTHSMRWWYESTANWVETQVYPDLPDNLDSAGAVFKSPDTCMLRYGGVNRVESGLHWYGMWVFNQFLSERYGAGLIRDVWLRMADGTGWQPFDDVLSARGTTLEAQVRAFALAVLLRDFSSGSDYPTARLQEAITAPGELAPTDGVQRLAMDYLGLELDGTYTIQVTSPDARVEGTVVGVNGTTAEVYPVGEGVTVDLSRYEHAYLIALNLTRPPNEAGCATARYTVSVQPAGENSPVGGASRVQARSFSPPRVEAVTDPADVPLRSPFTQTEYNIREEISTVDLPFRPITPRGAPEGFELDSVYGLNADELGESFVALNAPSGGVVAQMLYINGEGRLLRITQSPGIFATIGDWLAINGLEYAPGTQIWSTGGVDAAIVDPDGGGDGPWVVAFIARERFLVIDGDAGRDAMLDMAARFAASTR